MGDVRVLVFRASDAGEMVEAARVNRAFHASWAAPALTEEELAGWLERHWEPRARVFVVRDGEGVFLGCVTLSEIVRGGFQNAYLGFWGDCRMVGRGLMTAGVREVVRIAFREMGLHRLEANVQPENGRSLALLGRVGFRKEGFSPRYLRIGGVWRDHERWALLGEG